MWRSGNAKLSVLRLSDPQAALEVVKAAIRQAGGNVTAAASLLGMSRRTLYRWLFDHPNVLDEVRSVE